MLVDYVRRDTDRSTAVRQILEKNCPRSEDGIFADVLAGQYAGAHPDPGSFPYLDGTGENRAGGDVRKVPDRAVVLND